MWADLGARVAGQGVARQHGELSIEDAPTFRRNGPPHLGRLLRCLLRLPLLEWQILKREAE